MPESKQILVVDDEENIRTALSININRWGYNVVTAESGEEALNLIKNNPFDIVLTDLRLKGLNGIDLLKEIRESFPDTGTLIFTAYGEVDSYIEAMNLGAIDFFNKPINLEKLKKAINNFLTKRIKTIPES